jgi:hypothetical protein
MESLGKKNLKLKEIYFIKQKYNYTFIVIQEDKIEKITYLSIKDT